MLTALSDMLTACMCLQASGEAAEDLVVPRQELVQSLQLLDMNVYNNVFVGEQNGQGKKGAGTATSSAPRAQHIRMQPLVVRVAACRQAGRRGSHGLERTPA